MGPERVRLIKKCVVEGKVVLNEYNELQAARALVRAGLLRWTDVEETVVELDLRSGPVTKDKNKQRRR
jgi:hypothetical protein